MKERYYRFARLTVLVRAEEDIFYEEEGALQPYAAAAVRAGLTAGLPDWESLDADRPITGAEAAVILQNALDMPGTAETAGEDVPAWAAYAVSALEGSGMAVTFDAPLTREEAALLLHQASRLTAE